MPAIDQGEAVGRRCRLGLDVGADRRIRVSGRVILEILRHTPAARPPRLCWP